MTMSKQTKQFSQLWDISDGSPVPQGCKARKGAFNIRLCPGVLSLICVALMAGISVPGKSQSPALTVDASSTMDDTRSVLQYGPYLRPTHKTMAKNYLFDAFGPYPIVGAALFAGINQTNNTPPEWNQGFDGYSKRLASNYGIAMVATTTRYGLSEAFKEDSMYYRCNCSGLFPRVRHALISTLTARRGDDGHRIFSIPALVGPYAGTMTAAYGWYPSRYNAKDAFRSGSYSLLAYAGENISLEFFYSGPHSLLSRMHLNNRHGSSVEGPNK